MKSHRTRILVSCAGVHGIQDGLTSTIYVLLPVLAQSFGLSYAQIGMIRAVHSGLMWLLEIPAGILSERVGQNRLLVTGLIGAGTGYVSLSFAGGYHAVLLALFIAGCGAAFQHSLCSSLISGAFAGPGQRIALGTYNASGDSGKLVFTGIASLCLGFGLGWQVLVAGYGVLALVAAGVLWLVLRKVRTQAVNSGAAHSRQPGVGWGIRDRAGFGGLAAIVFFDIAVQDGFLVFVAFLMLEKQVTPSLAALAVVATLAGGVCGKFGCGYLAARMCVIRSLFLVEILTAAGLVAVYLAPAMAAFVLLPLLGVVLQGSSSITYGAVSSYVDEARQSRGFAMIYTTSSGAAVVAPIVFGLLADWVSIGAVIGTMAVVTLVPLPLCVLLKSDRAGA